MVARGGPTCRRNRKNQRGGTGGFGYSFGSAVPGTLGDAIVNRSPSCGEVNRLSPYSGTGHGLPGMNGGAYTNLFEVYGPNAISNQVTIPCEATRTQNPLNLASPSRITAPAPMVSSPFAIRGGKRTRKPKRRMNGGVGGVGSEFYIAPRAGYSHVPSNMAGGESSGLADGKTPFLLNVPYSSINGANPACSKTGGRRRSKCSSRRKNRKGKKSKKSRKH
jgi:hypothetical protein